MKNTVLLLSISLISRLANCQIVSDDGSFMPKNQPADQKLILKTYTGGVSVERLTILGGSGGDRGFVGIGITPKERLHVNGNILSSGHIDSDTAFINKITSHTGKHLVFLTDDKERFTIGTGGNASFEKDLQVGGSLDVKVLNPLSKLVTMPEASLVLTKGNVNLSAGAISSVDAKISKDLLVGGVLDANIISPSSKRLTVPEGDLFLTRGNLELTQGNFTIRGKVGINTRDVSRADLSVLGKIEAKDFQITKTFTPWPDYVFNPVYHLPALADTEKYLQKHGHLEGVPSAKEVEANGYSVNEMNIILLRKVEELTLHLIEQQKQINDLKASIKQ